jgi:peroxiredoxin Q/BCP
MKSVVAAAATFLAMAFANPASAALTVGAAAPQFTAPGAEAGKPATVDLSALLKQGPVVLYFFPSAFTDSAESRDFAANAEKFRAAGATVIGMSRDSVETLGRYSTESCDGKFPVASADESLVNAYDVNDGAMFNTRTTYVIDRSGKVVFVHDDDDHRDHVKRSLAFVEAMAK